MTHKTLLKFPLIFFALFVHLVNVNATESEPLSGSNSIHYGIEFDVASQYLWRGIELTNGPFSASELWCSFGKLTVSGWVAMPMEGNDDFSAWSVSEIDATISYEYDVKSFTINPSFNYVVIPNSEIVGELGMNIGCFPEPWYLSLSGYWDLFSHQFPYYGEAGLGYSWELTDELALDGALTAGWGSESFNAINNEYKGWALNTISLDLSSNWYITSKIYANPHCTMSLLPDKALRDLAGKSLLSSYGLAVGIEL